MESLSKEEVIEEIEALKTAITAHEQVGEANAKSLKVNKFELSLFEAELQKFK